MGGLDQLGPRADELGIGVAHDGPVRAEKYFRAGQQA